MTESDIQALNQCAVGESVTLSDGVMYLCQTESDGCYECGLLGLGLCGAINCVESERTDDKSVVFVEVPNDQQA